MILLNHIRLMAQYNQWMNQKIYEAAEKLTDDKLKEDKKAFFGSILGTLNHLMIGDIIWLKRFAAHPANHKALETIRIVEQPKSLDQVLYWEFEELRTEREKLDKIIINWCNELCIEDLQHKLYYKNMKGQPAVKLFGHLVLHLFNHQTHHRGQTTTLLSQEGLDVGVTDLLALISDEPEG
jgi:uncharacterized damage-inducible protein DinB